MTMSESTGAADWVTIGSKKRESIAALLPKQWQLDNVPSPADAPSAISLARQGLSQSEVDITENHSASELLSLLASGQLSAVEVTEAFCHRATIAHQLASLARSNSVTQDLLLMRTADKLPE